MQMQAAAVLKRGDPFAILRIAVPQPGPGTLRIAVKAVGICHTDLAFRDIELGTPLPMILGHEGAGIVDAIGEGVTGFAVGDRVAMSYDSCGHCPRCAEDQPQYCVSWPMRNVAGVTPAMLPPMATEDGQPLFGNFFGQSSFASHAIAYPRNCVKIPDALPFHLAAPLGCGMQTGAGSVMNSIGGKAGQSLAVFGAGAVGMAAIMAAHALGMAPIVAVDLVDARLDLALALGATHALKGGDGLAERLQAIAPGYDGVIDTTGVPAVLNTAIAALAPRGTAVILAVSLPGARAEIELSGFLSGKRILGVVEGDADPQTFVPMLAAMHLDGRFPHDRLVTTYPFAEINAAAADMESGRTIKPVLLMD